MKRKVCILGAVVILFLLLWGLDRAARKITYIESCQMNMEADSSVVATNNEMVLCQEFIMPYELFKEILVKTATFGRNNNSFWQVEIREKKSGKKIFSQSFNASQVSDGEYYRISCGTAKRVKQGGIYTITIKPCDVAGNSSLSFYISKGDAYPDGKLYLNGKEVEADLCFQIYGGKKDTFWASIYILTLTAAAVFLGYLFRKYKKGEKIKEGKLLGAVLIGIFYLILTYLFTRLNMGTFTDESDNIRGGMLIAGGKVLYKDYYTQHTPLAYYLCALFALLGAGSIPQFRMLYFILNAIIWGGLYYRHSSYFGRLRMMLLPVAQVIIVMGMFFQGSKIMGDNIQGICMIALVLEFVRYLEDRELGTSRCLITAMSIFCSVMSAFVSAFALAPIVLGVMIMEVLYWKDKVVLCVKLLLERYWKLFMACILPFLLTFVYFTYHHAIQQMYQMAYQFNTIVYKNYQNEYGRVKWKPFILGIKNYFTAFTDNLNFLFTAAGNETAVIQLLLVVLAGIALVLWAAKGQNGRRIIPAVCLFLCMTGNATRSSVDFHGAAFYNIAVTFIFILSKELQIIWGKSAVIAVGSVAAIYLSKPYVVMVADHIVYKQEIIGGIDKQVVELTNPGDLIFIDAFVHDSIYLMYKQRYPVNRNCYILPWYMDWFEADTVEDLENNQPVIAIYQPEMEIYGQKDFCPDLNKFITTRYVREGEDSILWKLK